MLQACKGYCKKLLGKDEVDYIFPAVDPAVDGEDCEKDCESCSVTLPKRWSIDESADLYGGVKPWGVHVVIATGKSDWVRDVADEKGSIMEALDRSSTKPINGRLMVSASNMCPPETYETNSNRPTTVLLLPAFIIVEQVSPLDIPELVNRFVNHSPSPSTPLTNPPPTYPDGKLSFHACPHDYIILLCSHKRRDARCGQSAPLIKRELERQLSPLGLRRDVDDERPGGVGIYFINHVGGHKFSANVLVYRKKEGQMIWLARIRPEHCEAVVKYTVLQGKVVAPEKRLRGGFDRGKGTTSW